MRIGYIECFAGISGDMLLAALVDAGVERELLISAADALGIGAELKFQSVNRSGIQATKVDVLVDGHSAEGPGHSHEREHDHKHEHPHDHHHEDQHAHPDEHGHTHEHGHEPHQHGEHKHAHGRSWKQIRALISEASLPERGRGLALRAFELLAHAEAKIHNLPVEEVHFHEVGAVDTITDIVCGAVGLASLSLDQWVCSPVNVGGGFVDCAHGRLPVPAPATAELLKGIPVYSDGPRVEMVTPTGAALLRALGCSFGEAPAMMADQIGYGAGTRNPERFPNVLRLTLGNLSAVRGRGAKRETISVMECAIDDATPQLIAHALDLALRAGAVDAMCAPVTMKKGRPASLLTVLARPADAAAIEDLLLRETTTLGLRVRTEERVVLDRDFTAVDTQYGRIRVKLGLRDGELLNAMPEYEDCVRAASEHRVPLKLVMQSAIAAFAEEKAGA